MRDDRERLRDILEAIDIFIQGYSSHVAAPSNLGESNDLSPKNEPSDSRAKFVGPINQFTKGIVPR